MDIDLDFGCENCVIVCACAYYFVATGHLPKCVFKKRRAKKIVRFVVLLFIFARLNPICSCQVRYVLVIENLKIHSCRLHNMQSESEKFGALEKNTASHNALNKVHMTNDLFQY